MENGRNQEPAAKEVVTGQENGLENCSAATNPCTDMPRTYLSIPAGPARWQAADSFTARCVVFHCLTVAAPWRKREQAGTEKLSRSKN
jgi:hypothetical protein